MEYPQEFSSKMELVQGMFELARAHRAYDEAEHPALKKMREERLRMIEEEWELKRTGEMEKVREKQKKWQESPDNEMLEDQNIIESEFFDDEEDDFDDFFNHDEL